jgi:hypothetical protein
MVEIDNRKAKLIAELEVSRGEIRGAFRHCEAQLDIPSRLRRSVRGRPLLWLSSASLVGWLVSKLLLAGSSAAASTSASSLQSPKSQRGPSIAIKAQVPPTGEQHSRIGSRSQPVVAANRPLGIERT